MKTLAMITALLLSAASQAQTVDICDRTPQVRDAILKELGTDDCAAVNSARMTTGIETLNLEQKGITELQAGDFDGLIGLRELNLRDNRLTTLPDGVFDRLGSLESLNLWINQLTSLPGEVFDGLSSLE